MSGSHAGLRAPFPYFGGKSKVAHEVWHRFGDVQNFVEPFCGSAAVLLARPTRPRIETVNDANCFIANFWRAIAAEPEAVAEYCDWPINEADLHARHRWLMLSGASQEWRESMKRDPEHYDVKIAAWWVWGSCQWIGAGWCDGTRLLGEGNTREGKLPALDHDKGMHAARVRGDDDRPALDAETQGTHNERRRPHVSSAGQGIHATRATDPDYVPGTHNERKRPETSHSGKGIHRLDMVAGDDDPYVYRKRPNITSEKGMLKDPTLWQQHPDLSGSRGAAGRGIHGSGLDNKRPRLTGYGEVGINAKAHEGEQDVRGKLPNLSGTYGERGAHKSGVLLWFLQLQKRLRRVRVVCGDWKRICTPAVTTGIGLTGVFLDPPYSAEANRDKDIYAVESGTVAHEVREWCLANGNNPKLRIALCGYEGEHDDLEQHGWKVHVWRTGGGYANQNKGGQGMANAKRERIWFSPHCLSGQEDLFPQQEKVAA